MAPIGNTGNRLPVTGLTIGVQSTPDTSPDRALWNKYVGLALHIRCIMVGATQGFLKIVGSVHPFTFIGVANAHALLVDNL